LCCCGLVKELSWHFPGGTEENHKIAVRRVGVPAKIQIEYLLNERIEHFHYTSLDMLLGQWEYEIYTEFWWRILWKAAS
jgi:hypothetical protein